MSKYGQNQGFSAQSDRKNPKAFLLTNENLSDQLYEQANRYRVLNLTKRLDFIVKIIKKCQTNWIPLLLVAAY